MLWFQKKGSSYIIILLLLLFLPSIFSLLRPGFFLSDDGEWMVIRFSAFHQALADGQFPVRFLSRLNHEYGYPVANFLYPGFMYLAEPIHFLGFGFVDTIKIVFGLSMVGSAVFSYLWLAKKFDRWGAFLGAMFYLYTPYHLFDLYKRGSVGELLALAVLPFVLWMIERKSLVFTSLGMAVLVLSHNTLAVLFLSLIIVYMLIRNISSLKHHALSMLLGFGASSFFWIPALLDLQYTKFLQTQVSNWRDHFATFNLIGISSIFVLVLSLCVLYQNRENLKEYRAEIAFFVVGVLGVFLSLPLSSILWEELPVAFVQFPFRFLSLTVVSIAFLSAFTIAQMRGSMKQIISAVLLILLAFSAFPNLGPAVFFDKGDSYYATNEDTTNVQHEYMPKWVKVIPSSRPENPVEIDNGEIFDLEVRPNSISFKANAREQTGLRINKIFFPGWQLFVDGTKMPIFYENDKGIITFPAYPGVHTYEARFAEFATSMVADIISLVSVCLAILLVVKRRKQYALW